MNYDGPYPYLEPTDQLHDVPSYSRELAELLELPAGGSATAGTITLTAGMSAFTLVPGLATSGFTLGSPTLCAVMFSALINHNTSAYAHLRVRITNGDGSISYLDPLQDRVLLKPQTDNPYARTWMTRIVPGSSSVVGQMEYTTPSSSTTSLTYPKLEIVPIRPVA